MSQVQLVQSFLRTQKLCVISTINLIQATPESALIAFVEDEELNLYFQTSRETRKAKNLELNRNVSFVIGSQENPATTVQYEGAARQLINDDEIAACKQRFLAKASPSTLAHLEKPTTIFFRVTPTWIGYSDYSQGKPNVFEISPGKG